MVGHQYIGMYMATVTFGHFVEHIQITLVVHFGKETGFSVVAALDDMLRNAGETKAGFTRHILSPTCKLLLIKRIIADANIIAIMSILAKTVI